MIQMIFSFCACIAKWTLFDLPVYQSLRFNMIYEAYMVIIWYVWAYERESNKNLKNDIKQKQYKQLHL